MPKKEKKKDEKYRAGKAKDKTDEQGTSGAPPPEQPGEDSGSKGFLQRIGDSATAALGRRPASAAAEGGDASPSRPAASKQPSVPVPVIPDVDDTPMFAGHSPALKAFMSLTQPKNASAGALVRTPAIPSTHPR